MPINASDCAKAAYLRLLVMAPPKAGKTTTTLMTCEKPAYVINCDDDHSLIPAARKTTDFVYDNVFAPDPMTSLNKAIKEAADGVKAGRYKTIILDTISVLSRRLMAQLEAPALEMGKQPDGRKTYPEHENRLIGAVERLFRLKAHVIVLSHFIEVGGEAEGQLAKTGAGIAPLLAGKARATIPALFQDVVFLEKKKDKSRVFITSIDGVWGPGCRSLSATEVPADIMGFWKLAQKEGK